MTLDTCLKLLQHYRDLADGKLMRETADGRKSFDPATRKHAQFQAELMEKRVAKKARHPKYADHPYNQSKKLSSTPPTKPTKKKEGGSDGKKST